MAYSRPLGPRGTAAPASRLARADGNPARAKRSRLSGHSAGRNVRRRPTEGEERPHPRADRPRYCSGTRIVLPVPAPPLMSARGILSRLSRVTNCCSVSSTRIVWACRRAGPCGFRSSNDGASSRSRRCRPCRGTAGPSRADPQHGDREASSSPDRGARVHAGRAGAHLCPAIAQHLTNNGCP